MEALERAGRLFRNDQSRERDPTLDEQYGDIVKKAYREEKNKNLSCVSPEHAKLASRLLLEGATEEVKIHQGIAEETFYQDDEIAEAFGDARERGVEVGILLQESADEEFERFCDEKDVLFRDEVQPETEKSHFLLVDNKSYRLEEPHDPERLEEEPPDAIVNFNNEDWANRMREGYLELIYY